MYQKSNMGTLKFHLLIHICEDLNRLGSILVCDAGIYEQSHKLFKFIYNYLTNKQLSTALERTITKLGKQINNNVAISPKKRRIQFRTLTTSNNLLGEEELFKPTLSRYYTTARLIQLSLFMDSTTDSPENTIPKDINILQDILGKDILLRMIKCLFDIIDEDVKDRSIFTFCSVTWSKSCYMYGYKYPTLDMCDGDGLVYMNKDSTKVGTRIMSNPVYYGSKNGRFDTVMIRHKTSTRDGLEQDAIWFGKVLSFITIKSSTTKDTRTGKCTLHHSADCDICNPIFLGSYAFVQYYDVIPESDLPIDGIEKN